MKLQHVPLEFVHTIWGRVEEILTPAMQYSQGDYTLEQIKVLITTGQWMLLVVTNEAETITGACTITFFNRPNDRVAFMTTASGRGVINNDVFDQLTNLVKSFGATYIEAACRESMVRLLERQGFKEKYRIVGVKI